MPGPEYRRRKYKINKSDNLNNFNNLQIIGSPDLFDEGHNEFLVDKETISFVINDSGPVPCQEQGGIQRGSPSMATTANGRNRLISMTTRQVCCLPSATTTKICILLLAATTNSR